MRPRQLMNGDLIFPKKGDVPPSVPDGFWADEKNPWLMHVIFEPCEHRTREERTTDCGAKKFIYWCSRENSMTTYFNCKRCKDAETQTSIDS